MGADEDTWLSVTPVIPPGFRGGEHVSFCGWPCLAEYATSKVMIDGATGGPS